MVGSALETEREHSTKKKVIVSVDRHFCLGTGRDTGRVKGTRVPIEGGHMNFLENQSMVIFFDSGESEGFSRICFIPFGGRWLT